jgi:hypothetical protein
MTRLPAVLLPAVLLSVAMLIVFATGGPYPDPAPVHFRLDGTPDRWGHWWEMPVVLLAISALLIAIAVAVERSSARSSVRTPKAFTLILNGLHALLFMVAGSWVEGVLQGRVLFGAAAVWVWAVALLAVGGGILLERRSSSPTPLGTTTAEPPADLVADIDARQVTGQPWAYWSEQNPFYAKWLFPVLGVLFLVLAFRPDGPAFLRPINFVGGLVLLAMSGGFQTVVTGKRLVLRMGYLGVPLLRVPLEHVAAAGVHAFSPVGDFGGWGIRRRRGITAFILEGNVGVLVQTRADRKYLIGTDRPERLAAVLETARRSSARLAPPLTVR